MHGLVNTSLQNFVVDVYGAEVWREVAGMADLGFERFEAMLLYHDDITHSTIAAASARLGKSRDDILEDMGIYLVSHPNMSRIRRLLRFGGSNFVEFLESLDDLPERMRLAVPDLEMPRLRLVDRGQGRYWLHCGRRPEGTGQVILGALRAVADDYGALAFVDRIEAPEEVRASGDLLIEITVLSTSFAAGRAFELTGRTT